MQSLRLVSLMTVICACLVSGCATSPPSSEVASIRLAELPASVRTEAARVVPVPKGPCDAACAKVFVAALKKSELRKVRALSAAVKSHDKNKQYLAKRGKRKAT